MCVYRGGINFNPSLERALILNSGYEPIKIIDWKKAIVLWLQGRVDVIEFHKTEVRSATKCFRLPSVIRLRKYICPRVSVKERPSRLQIFRRDAQTCQYCQQWFPVKKLTLDHVIPLSKGGGHTWENLVTSCASCNNKKGDKTLKQVGYRLLQSPRRPKSLVGKTLQGHSAEVPLSWRPFLLDLLE